MKKCFLVCAIAGSQEVEDFQEVRAGDAVAMPVNPRNDAAARVPATIKKA